MVRVDCSRFESSSNEVLRGSAMLGNGQRVVDPFHNESYDYTRSRNHLAGDDQPGGYGPGGDVSEPTDVNPVTEPNTCRLPVESRPNTPSVSEARHLSLGLQISAELAASML